MTSYDPPERFAETSAATTGGTDAPPLAPPVAGEGERLSFEVFCVRCGRPLQGLQTDLACPQCATPVAESVNAQLLSNASPERLQTMHRGIVLVQGAVVALFLFGVVGVAIVLWMSFWAGFGGSAQMPGPATNAALLALSVLNMLAYTGVFLGWWMISAPPDPDRAPGPGERARAFVRISLVAALALTIGSSVFSLAMMQSQQSQGTAPVFNASVIASMLVSLLATAGLVIAFIAQMLFLRRLAPGLPSGPVHDRAALLTWLGPVLITVGGFCVGLGPLVAMVLYWNLLDRVRKDVKRIRRAVDQERGYAEPERL